MAGIRVNTPKGAGWQYSLDQQTWQSSRVFLTQPGGLSFVADTEYIVYCRNLTQKAQAIAKIVFGQDTSDVSLTSLSKGATAAQRSAFLLSLLSAADGPTRAKFCELVSSCGMVTPTAPEDTFDQFVHYELVAEVVIVPSTPNYVGRVDANTCSVISGWILNTNDPATPEIVRIEVDGVAIANVEATIVRIDRDAILIACGLLPGSTTANVFGYTFYKPTTYNTGSAHIWRVFGGNSAIELPSDVPGYQASITCGVPANPAPTLNNSAPNVVITTAVGQGWSLSADEFTDNAGDPHTLHAFRYDAATNTLYGLFAWLDFDAATRSFIINNVVPAVAGQWVCRMVYADSDNQAATDDYIVTVNAVVVLDPNANPPSHDDLTAYHSNDFSGVGGNDPADWPIGYSVFGDVSAQWSWPGNGELCQTNISAGTDHKAIRYTQNSSNSLDHTVTYAKIKPTRLNTNSRLGVGLRYAPGVDQGYQFVILDNNTVGFVHSSVANGPTAAYATEIGHWYWIKEYYQVISSSVAHVYGKIWKAGEAEPTDWTLAWEVPAVSGYPALFGGFNDASACFDFWADGNLLTN